MGAGFSSVGKNAVTRQSYVGRVLEGGPEFEDQSS